eukprot:TRINITY_DN39_c0_g1_i1.p1 TRINITY_DN39_c0_g1~~TRINITY_DN39_c0_g1_i1.p1  ORF type:complete len:542 (-),score=77.35 TRINITY_DN39_c0_g1_i1:146-1771(-)
MSAIISSNLSWITLASLNFHSNSVSVHSPLPKRHRNCVRLQTLRMAAVNSIELDPNLQEAQSASRLNNRKVVVVGAGPAGCIISLLLLQRGFHVQIFERRLMTKESSYKGDIRSYPILLTTRGLKAIEAAGVKLDPSILKPQKGSCAHQPNGKVIKLDYYSGHGVQSFIASRNALVSYLQNSLLERAPSNSCIKFGWQLSSIDDTRNIAKFSPTQNPYGAEDKVHDMPKHDDFEVEFDLLIGADGISSRTRSEILRLDQKYSSTGENFKKQPIIFDFKENPRMYKAFCISPSVAAGSGFVADADRVHAWRSLNMMLIKVADGSFWGGILNNEILDATSPVEVERKFRERAPDVLNLLLHENPNFIKDFWKQKKMKSSGAVMLSQFHFKNIVLLGDAAHAMFPTLGTGCNSALEDCLIFDKIVGELTPTDGREFPYHLAAEEFTKRRIKDAHSIVEMNMNFFLLPRNPLGIIQEMIFSSLHKWFPQIFGPTAYQLLWTEAPFSESKAKKSTENKIFFGILLVCSFFIIVIVGNLFRKMAFRN